MATSTNPGTENPFPSTTAQNPQSTNGINSGTPETSVQPTLSSLQNAASLNNTSGQITLAPTTAATTRQNILPTPKDLAFHPSALLIVIAVVIVLSLVGAIFKGADKTTTN